MFDDSDLGYFLLLNDNQKQFLKLKRFLSKKKGFKPQKKKLQRNEKTSKLNQN